MNAVPHRWLMIALFVATSGGCLFAFVLFGRLETDLQVQERDRLAAVGRTLSLELGRALPGAVESTAGIRSLGARLDQVRLMRSLEGVFVADRSGVVLVDARSDDAEAEPGDWDDVQQSRARAAWSGDEVFVPASGAGHAKGGIFFAPVTDENGEVTHIVGLVVGPAFREALARLSPLILGSRVVAGALLALIALAVAGSMRRSLREIRRESGATDAVATRSDHDQFVFDTFHGIVSNLKESQTELRTLYTRAEERAATLENVVSCMLRSLTTGVLIFDPDRKVLLINAAAQSILRLPPRSFAGAGAASLFRGDEEWLRHVDALFAGEPPPRGEVRLTGSAGESWVGVTSSLIRDPSESVLGGVFLLTDLTETKRLRQRLALKERLAVMGEISSGVAHELRNSLATILGYCRLLERETPASEPARDYLDKLRSEVRVLEETSEGLLDLVRLGRRHSEPIEIDALLAAALQAVGERCEMSAIVVEKRAGAGGAVVDADATALRKAVENIIENGVQAMERGGTLTLETRVVSRGETSRALAPQVEEMVEIVIADEGPGMRAEVIGQIFTPFFTTKRRGTGLGLAIVQKTIAEHDGMIDVASEQGHGTRFRILLPCRPATSGSDAARAGHATAAPAYAAGATVAVPALHEETAQ